MIDISRKSDSLSLWYELTGVDTSLLISLDHNSDDS